MKTIKSLIALYEKDVSKMEDDKERMLPINNEMLDSTYRLQIAIMRKVISDLEPLTRITLEAGVNGCTYGDTNHDSISVAYGYNLAINEIVG
ncbi:MAG: hypothetical protein ACPGJS_00715 [Flammeovirgaceae bacterium]